MDFSQIEQEVSKYAPLLGSVISESNPISGLIIMAIANAFDSPSDPASIITSIQHDHDAESKLLKVQEEHSDALLQNQIEDRSNAREREEKIVAITGHTDRTVTGIACVVIFGFFVLCGLNYFVKLDDDRIVVMLIGQVSGAFMMVVSYFFGNNR
jgi:uncharacterized membrane protein YraQ (UPF0718 family)